MNTWPRWSVGVSDFPSEGVPAVLLPWLYKAASASASVAEESGKESGEVDAVMDFSGTLDLAGLKAISGSLALQVQEIGYAFTASADCCRRHLDALGATTSEALSSAPVANVLAMMARTHCTFPAPAVAVAPLPLAQVLRSHCSR